MRYTFLFFLFACLGINCNNDDKKVEPVTDQGIITPAINYAVVSSMPHDTNAFTEGLLVHNGELYESTGAPERMNNVSSSFGVVDMKTGIVDKKVEIDKTKYFGEGIVFFGDKVYQLTYQTKVGFIYDAKTFKKLGEFQIPTAEGWGMTRDSSNIIMSDGTPVLTYLDPVSLGVVKQLSVADNKGPVDKLNELEYINGFIYANIYGSNFIVKINPATGKVLGQLDLVSLNNEAKGIYPGSLEMNGIAYDPGNDKVYVTGKMWPKIYVVKFSL